MAWGLQLLEELLRFFHGACASYLAKLSPQSRNKLLANIDVAAADAFYAAKDPKQKNSVFTIQKLLLKATDKYLEPLGIIGREIPPCESWIDFKNAADQEPAQAAEKMPSALRDINFDEATGKQLNTQVELPVASGKKKK